VLPLYPRATSRRRLAIPEETAALRFLTTEFGESTCMCPALRQRWHAHQNRLCGSAPSVIKSRSSLPISLASKGL